MLTDVALKNLKPREKPYKVTDRDGMYAYVSPGGAISFRFDYRMHGRRETLTLGRYGPAGLSLARAREKCIDARRALADGRSPAQEKQRDKRRLREAKSFGEFGERWLERAPMADSTRAMRRSIFERELRPAWQKRLLTEIQPDDLRTLCGKIVDRGAPATAIHVRDIVKQIYGFAILHGERVPNPADEVGPSSVAIFDPRAVQAARARRDPTDHKAWASADPAYDGSKERVAGRDVGRGRLRERCLEYSEGAYEALASAQRLPFYPGAGHHGGAEDLCGQLQVPSAVSL